MLPAGNVIEEHVDEVARRFTLSPKAVRFDESRE